MEECSPRAASRSISGSGNGEDIEPLASQVFETLAGSAGSLSRELFRQCSASLAQLSGDFATEGEEGFDRIDTNDNDVIELDEFLHEIQNIKELLGTRKLASALAEVCADLRSKPPPKRVIPKPTRGPYVPGEEDLQSLMIRGRVIKKVMRNFEGLQGNYNKKLQELEAACNRLRESREQADEEVRPGKWTFAQEAASPSSQPRPRRTKSSGGSRKGKKGAAAASTDPSNAAGDAARIAKDVGASEVADDGPADEEEAGEEEAGDDEEGGSEQDPEDGDGEDGDDDDEEEEDVEDEGEEDEGDEDDDEIDEEEDEDDDDDEEEDDEEDEEAAAQRKAEKKRQKQEAAAAKAAAAKAAAAEAAAAKAAAAKAAEEKAAKAAEEEEAARRAAPAAETEEKPSQPTDASEGGVVAGVPDAPQPKPPRKPKKKTKASSHERPLDQGLETRLRSEVAALKQQLEAARAEVLEVAATARAEPAPPVGAAPTVAARRNKTDKEVKDSEADKTEGVRCTQTLDLGIAVKAAICLGKEVWTVDTQGRVSIRDRDNAAQVKAEIPTNRFCCCMAYLEPGLMLTGLERDGIQVFDCHHRSPKALLGGGHSGKANVWCIALGDGIDDSQGDTGIPSRRFWSGSNDFTIRQWIVATWPKGTPDPPEVSAASGRTVIECGRWKVGISRGLQMHGHKLPVKCLLRIGPILWSGSDDGTIRLWYTADSAEAECVDNAHKGGVEKMSVVRSFVWSCGADGLIKEWTIGGTKRQLVRQVSPPGFDKVYAVCPLGFNDVWTCGHNPNIQVYSQKTMQELETLPAHEGWVSNLLAVDRIETKIVWSTSLGDKKLKVWRHTVRGEVPSFDEMKAANKLFEEEQQGMAGRMTDMAGKNSELKKELDISEDEFKKSLEDLAKRLLEAQGELDAMEARKKHLHGELDGLRKLFDDAGLKGLMDDPASMRDFLDRAACIEQTLKDLGLGHLLDNPDELRRVLENMQDMADMLKKAGFGDVLNDPAKLAEFAKALDAMGKLKQMFEEYGFGDVFGDPGKLEALRQALENMKAFRELIGDADPAEALEALRKLKDLLESCGFGDIFEDPSKLADLQKFLESAKSLRGVLESYGHGGAFEDSSILAEILSRYNGLKQACEEYGFPELFEDPYTMKGFLRIYGKIREAFRDEGLEYLLESSSAMRDFLRKHKGGEEELKDMRMIATKLEKVEAQLHDTEDKLAKALAEITALKEQLSAYQAIGSLEDFAQWKKDAKEFNIMRKRNASMSCEVDELRKQLEEKERERQEALERERIMALRYKELDIFKLDIIARELKAIDNKISFVDKQAKHCANDCQRLRNYDEQQQIIMHPNKMRERLDDMSAHIKDVIEKCLSETQKLHIGAAVNEHRAAGELQDGGVMGGTVVVEVERPDHGRSVAARLRQDDEMSREARLRRRPRSPAPG